MATSFIVRVCAIAATIGICSMFTLAEPISMSAKLNSAITSGGPSQHFSASLLSVRAISLSGVNKQSQTSPTSFSMGANMMGPAVSVEKIGTPLFAVSVPEPSAMLLLGSGLLTALGYRARRKLTKSA